MKNTMTWQVAAASELGRHHRLLGKNRQDALCYSVGEDAVLVAVTDGCGSAPHSEVGAYLGAHAAVRTMRGLSVRQPDFCTRVAAGVRAVIDRALLEDAFLFTLCGACITSEGAIVFMFGDGVVAVNGQVFSRNDEAPDYLAYHDAPEPSFVRFEDDPQEIIVATDGCEVLPVEDRFFSHTDALRRAIAKRSPHDDATMVIVRGRK